MEETDLAPLLPVIQGLMRFRPVERISARGALELLACWTIRSRPLATRLVNSWRIIQVDSSLKLATRFERAVWSLWESKSAWRGTWFDNILCVHSVSYTVHMQGQGPAGLDLQAVLNHLLGCWAVPQNKLTALMLLTWNRLTQHPGSWQSVGTSDVLCGHRYQCWEMQQRGLEEEQYSVFPYSVCIQSRHCLKSQIRQPNRAMGKRFTTPSVPHTLLGDSQVGWRFTQ